MDFTTGQCRSTWAFLPAWKHPWHLWTAGVCLAASSLLHSSWERRVRRIKKCIHSRTFIHTVNLLYPCKCKINPQKMMRHQFSSNTGVIKKTINIYRANESWEITKCVFSNALLMWCLLCIYKQEQIHEMKVVGGESENVLERMICVRMFWVMHVT